jgi:hypothetical protein
MAVPPRAGWHLDFAEHQSVDDSFSSTTRRVSRAADVIEIDFHATPKTLHALMDQRQTRLLETLVNVLVTLLPTDCIAVMAAMAIRAAIRPYSIAVAPLMSRFIERSLRITMTPCSKKRFHSHGREATSKLRDKPAQRIIT